MAVVLVTYDLKQPGRNYEPVWEYLRSHTYCKHLESVWLLETSKTVATIRDELRARVDANDKVLAAQMTGNWASLNFGCAEWLNRSERRW